MAEIQDRERLNGDSSSGCIQSAGLNWEQLTAAIALQIRQSLDAPTILQTTVDQVQRLIGCDRALLYRFFPDRSGQVVVEALSDPQWSLMDRVVHDACFVASWLQPYEENQSRVIADVAAANLSTCYAEFLAGFQIKANLVIPVLCESELWGLLIAHSCTAPRDWQEAEIVGLQQIAVHVGIALYQADLVAQLQASNANLEAQAELALRQSHDQRLQLAAIVESSQDAIISKTPEGIITSWNRAAERLFGYSAAEAIGQPITLIIPPDRQTDEALICQHLHQGQSIETYETQRQCKDGRLVEVALTISPVQDETGVLVGASKIARDITAQRQAQRALQEQTAILQSFYNSSPLMMGVVELSDDDILFISGNQASATFFHTPLEAFAGQWVSELGAPRERIQTWMRHYHQSQALGRPVQFDLAYTTETKPLWLSATVSFIGIADSQRPRFSFVAADISDRKQAEQALRTSEARYAALVQVSPVGIFRTDASGDCLYANTRWCELAELSPNEAQGQGWVAAIHPDDRDRVFAEWYQAAASNQPFHSEYRFQTPAGVVSWLIGQAIAEKDASGETVGYIGTITNITDRKQAEADLHHLNLVLENAVEGIARLDSAGQYLSVNRAYATICGYEPHDLLGRVWTSTVYAEDLPTLEAVYETMQATGKVEAEARGVRQDGSLFYKQITMIADYDPQGVSVGHYCFLKDISDRKQAEADLQASEARWQFALEGSGDGVWDWNPQTNVLFVSRQWKAILGYGEDEVGTTLDEWSGRVHPDDLEQCYANLQHHFSGETSICQNEYRMRCKDDSYKWVFSGGKVIEWAETGEPLRMIGTLSDISDRKQMELDLRAKNQELDQFFSVALDLLCIADTDGHFRRFNQQWQQTLGYSLAELQGAKFLDYVHPEDLTATLEAVNQLANQQTVNQFVNRYRCQDGSYRWLDWHSAPVGNLIYAAARDITVRKQIELDLKQAKEQLDLVLQASSEGFCDWNVLTNEIYFSPQFKAILGYTDAEFENSASGWEAVVFKEDAERAWQLIEEGASQSCKTQDENWPLR